MNYRQLGRSGLRVSEIGLGCEGLVAHEGRLAADLIDAAQRLGVNCLDLYTPDPAMRRALRQTLQGRREQFVLQCHLCSIWEDGQYKRTRDIEQVRAGFDSLFEEMALDRAEIGMIHYVDSLEDWRQIVQGPVLDYARELLRQGKIGCLGLSSHNPEVALEAVKSGLIDVLLFSVNPCYDLQPPGEEVEQLWVEDAYKHQLVNMNPERETLYELCQREGVGITVMKAFGGGDLLDATLSPAGVALTPYQCLHYALTRPGVASVMTGAHSVEQLERCAAYCDATDAERDYAQAFAAFPSISWKGHCMYCGHCAPCPQGIDVAAVTKFRNLARAQGSLPETVREHYALLPHGAGECIGCGACQARCPFEVPIIENMRSAAALFGR